MPPMPFSFGRSRGGKQNWPVKIILYFSMNIISRFAAGKRKRIFRGVFIFSLYSAALVW